MMLSYIDDVEQLTGLAAGRLFSEGGDGYMSIKKIAEKAGVSPATVSRVLNNPNYKCSVSGLRDKIWKTAIEMNYVPNEAARNLKKGVSAKQEKTWYINILMTRTDSSTTDPFFAELLRVIESEIHDKNCILSKVWYMSVFSDDRKCRRENLDRLIDGMYDEVEGKRDGLIIIGRCNKEALKKLNKKYKSVVSVNRNSIIPDPVWCESGAGKKYETYQREGCIMDEKKKQASGPVKWILIGISVIFLFVMLVLPLVVVVTQALSKGWQCYVQAVTDEYTLKALKLTIGATAAAVVCNTIFGLCAAWAMTRFHFRGKKLLTTLIDVPVTVSPVIAGLIYILVFGKQSPLYSVLESAGIQIVFAVPGIVLATIFVTFPFVSREIIPVLESIGSDEEEAAALMGAKGWTIFTKVTFPHIKWAFLYGVVLCTARAMGEFGAVSVLSGHLRGKTNTLPLHVEILYNEFQYVPAFAVSSILVILAVILLIARNVLEHKGKGEKGDVR